MAKAKIDYSGIIEHLKVEINKVRASKLSMIDKHERALTQGLHNSADEFRRGIRALDRREKRLLRDLKREVRHLGRK